MRYTFRASVGGIIVARQNCFGTPCRNCYIEELWRSAGHEDCNHCSKTQEAFYALYRTPLSELPEKDDYVILKLKSGKTVHAKLFYDEEGCAGMYYDDFDNWYSLQDVEAVFQSPLNECVTIAVEYP